MPHQCTGCGHTFADGSKEMLSGCPTCGGNTFQFRPSGRPPDGQPSDASPPEADEPPVGDPPVADSTVAESVGRATTRVRDFVTPSPPESNDRPDPDAAWPEDDTGRPDESTVGRPAADRRTSSAPEGPSEAESAPRSELSRAEVDESGWQWGTRRSPSGAGDIIDADARRHRHDDDGGEDVAQADARSDVVSPEELGIDGSGGVAGGGVWKGGGVVDNERSHDGEGLTEGVTEDDEADGTNDSGSTSPTDSPGEPPAERPEGERPAAERPATERRAAERPPDGETPDLAELREQLNDQFESIKIVEPGQYELNLMELYDREEYIIALQENGRYVIQVPEQWLGDQPGDR